MNWYKQSGIWDDLERNGPSATPYSMNRPQDISKYYEQRRKFRQDYAFAVPTQESVERIKAFVGNGQILEVGAGTGLWAKLLRDAGIRVTPTDNHSWSKKGLQIGRHTEIENLGHLDAVNKYKTHDTLMMVWPPYNNPMANDTLKAFPGNKLIYIGEGHTGCTADDGFFCTLENEWVSAGSVCIPQWDGMHDCVELFNRK